jgi:hypothetical protein
MPSIFPKSGSVQSLVSSSFDKVKTSLNPVFNAVSSRLSGANLLPGGIPLSKLAGSSSTNIQFADSAQDWRVKISVAPGSGVLYDMPNAGIMEPIKKSNGVIFPYAPSLTVQHQARYGSQPLTHTNYNNYYYEGSEVQSIQITADFTVQNLAEATYFLGALYFFRAATKMFYGESGKYQGAPPPIVYLDGYGAHYLPHVPCIVTGFGHTMPADVDYIEASVQAGGGDSKTNPLASISPGNGGGFVNGGYGSIGSSVGQAGTPSNSAGSATKSSTRVPTSSQFTVTLQPVYSRNAQRAFNVEAFARGELLSRGYL